LGRKLGRLLKEGDVIALSGELGSGKTCMTKGLALGLGVPEEEVVTSPSFTYLNEYEGRETLYHMDVYRLAHLSEFLGIGLDEYLGHGGVAVLEWADFAAAGKHLYAYHVYSVPFTARLEAYGLSASAIDAYGEQARSQRDADLTALVAALARSGGTSHVVERGEPAVLLSRYIESVRPSLVVLGRSVGGKRSSPPSRVGSVSRYIASAVSADALVV